MCNKTTKKQTNEDYRFLDYRLTQYEIKLDKGLDNLKTSNDKNYQDIMKILTTMQQGQNQQQETLIRLTEEQNNLKEKINKLEQINENITTHKQQIETIFDRLNTYKQLLTLVGTAAVSAILVEIIKFI